MGSNKLHWFTRISHVRAPSKPWKGVSIVLHPGTLSQTGHDQHHWCVSCDVYNMSIQCCMACHCYKLVVHQVYELCKPPDEGKLVCQEARFKTCYDCCFKTWCFGWYSPWKLLFHCGKHVEYEQRADPLSRFDPSNTIRTKSTCSWIKGPVKITSFSGSCLQVHPWTFSGINREMRQSKLKEFGSELGQTQKDWLLLLCKLVTLTGSTLGFYSFAVFVGVVFGMTTVFFLPSCCVLCCVVASLLFSLSFLDASDFHHVTVFLCLIKGIHVWGPVKGR